MKAGLDTAILNKLGSLSGHIGFYYKNLITGEELCLNDNSQCLAASVIKLPIYMAIMKLCAEGELDMSERLVCHDEDKLPPCGALYFFTNEPEVDVQTLCGLMISLSDNTATNMLIRRVGMDRLNSTFLRMGLSGTHIERLLFDAEASKNGRQNYIVPKEMGMLLESVYTRRFVSGSVSEAVEKLLLEQQINHKIPGYLENIEVAHKTGEDEGLTNDVGIVYAREPFIMAFAASGTAVAETEICIRETARLLAYRQD